ncbi:MAG: hypothetical protein LBM22_01415 [Endomicrobium sp.]|nr:hypothetical protein [Endomicrobium sp.]
MLTYSIKRINIISVLKTIPIVLLIQGLFSACLTLCLSLKDITAINLKDQLFTCAIFTISYTVIALCSILIMICIYNTLSLKFNKQIVITLDLIEE